MNRDAFDYIVANNLWNAQGQMAWFDKEKPVSFPKEAIEIKAEWMPIHDEDKPRYHWNVDAQGKTLGLTGLHITTKDLPDWFWATFEQVSNPSRCKPGGCKDTFGVDANQEPTAQWLAFMRDHGMASEWSYYRLTGSQIDFVEPTGKPVNLGNSAIEGRAQNLMKCSSCLSCHAQSRMQRNGFSSFRYWVGPPRPSWFDGTVQMDFVWSLNEARSDPPGENGALPISFDCPGRSQ